MHDEQTAYRMAFASIHGMNRLLAEDLIRKLGSEQAFFQAEESRLRYITSSRSRIYSASYRAEALAKARTELDFVCRSSISAIYHTDPGYPPMLRLCDDAPLMLYGLGSANLTAPRILAVVGTRHATPYGISFTEKVIEELAAAIPGLVIVSGLAYGIDITAHRAALRHGLPTVAVLAHGLHTIYPAEHRSTAVAIIKNGGMLLSEYRSDEPVHKGNFVARNRIVAGMSHALLVVESAEKGGALITAGLAADYGRDVFALPGRISDPVSAGCNRLIAACAASLVRSADDICRAMNWPASSPAHDTVPAALPIPMNIDEESIVKFLDHNEDATVSQITAATGMPAGKLMSLLIDMEFRNLILALPGGRYRALI
ncbi:MAG: DNA-processing protein DprA [Muribaculaceae bacterium]|nr:DNA-processing protein DprA [Muribaculaceae bacterium]